MSKFKILGVGIDTRTLDYVPSDEFDFDYMMTSVSALIVAFLLPPV